MPITKLKTYLDENGVKYTTISHSVAYTAQEIASAAHVRGKDLAKTVVVRVDGDLAMAVLPASLQVDLEKLARELGARDVALATENEFRFRFPDCEPGAMPPFGNMYGMPVFVDQTLTADPEIAFNAGTHRELVRLAYADFARLAQPKVLNFARQRVGAAA
jgi:Ala-tRNA(Pro) deacylase